MAKIDNQERIGNLKDCQYKELLGVDKPTFDKMLEIMSAAFAKLHEQGGKPPKLAVLDKLVITLGYWREYRGYRNIAFDYGVGKSTIGDAVIWVEDTLIKDGSFSLPSKRELAHNKSEREAVIADVAEQPIERPKRGRKNGIQAKRNSIPSKP